MHEELVSSPTSSNRVACLGCDRGKFVLPEDFINLKNSFQETTLVDVGGCLKYGGTAQSIDKLENAIRQGVEEQWNDIG